MLQVNRRGGFSDRQGINQQNTEIQLVAMDLRTRSQIFSLLSDLYAQIYYHMSYFDDSIQGFFRYILTDAW